MATKSKTINFDGHTQMCLQYPATIYDSEDTVNESFAKAKMRIAYVGENRNNTFITEETFNEAIPTMFNCPIVAHYDRETDSIGSHDDEVIDNGDGSYSVVHLTQPVGVVPESANFWWEDVEEEDGSLHKYLCADCLLWKRQESFEKIQSDGITDQSMEVRVIDGSWVDGCYHINKMEFQAFCLLGSAEPCFESASVAVYDRDNAEMMAEFKEMLCELHQATGDLLTTSKDINKSSKKGEKGMATKKSEAEQKSVAYADDVQETEQPIVEAETTETIDSSADLNNDVESVEVEDVEVVGENAIEETDTVEASAEEAVATTEEMNVEEAEEADDVVQLEAEVTVTAEVTDVNVDIVESSADDSGDAKGIDSPITVMQMTDEICRVLDDYKFHDAEWDVDIPRYYLQDIQDNEVIVWDAQEDYICGIAFTFDDNSGLHIDFDSAKRKKVVYEDWVNGTFGNNATYSLKAMFNKCYDFQKQVADLTAENLAYRAENQKKERQEELAEVFAEFDKNTVLCDLDEYQEYKSKTMEESTAETESVKEYCYALLGKTVNFNYIKEDKDTDAHKLGVTRDFAADAKERNSKQDTGNTYGGILTK